MGPLPRSRERALRRGARAPRSAPADRRLPARRARPRRRPRADRSRHADAAGGSARREPSHPDPARRLPDRRGDARRARRGRRAHPHPAGVRALGAAQPGLLTPDAPAGPSGPGGARRPGGVPARAPDRSGAREPRGPDERTDAPRGAVPRAAEHLGGGAGRRHRDDRGAHPAAAVAPLHLANHPRGAPRGVSRGSSAAVPRPRRAGRAARRGLRVHPAPRRDEAAGRLGHDRPARAAGADVAALRRVVPGPAAAAVRVPSDGRADREIAARTRLPGRAQAQSCPGRGIRLRAAVAARHGSARGLDLVPRDRAAEPRGRGAHDRGRRLERPGLAARRRLVGDRRHAAEHDPGDPYRAGLRPRHVRPSPVRDRDRPRHLRGRWMVAIGLLGDADRPDPGGIEDLALGLRPPRRARPRSRCRSTSRRPPRGSACRRP